MAVQDNLISKAISNIKNTANNLFNQGNNAISSFGQSSIGQGIVNAQKWVESSRPIQAPTVQPFTNSTTLGKIGNGAVNIPISLIESTINTPITIGSDVGKIIGGAVSGRGLPAYSQVKSSPFKLAYNLKGQNNTPKEIAGNIAGTGMDALNIALAGNTGNTINALKGGLVAPTLRQSLIRGGIEGGAIGTGFGLLGGVKDNASIKDNNLYYKNIGTQAVQGLLGGAAVGAAGGAVSFYGGKLFNKISENLQKIKPELSQEQNKQLTQRYIRDEVTGLFKGSVKANQDRPIFYGDLNESLGLPRNPNNQRGSIDFGEIGKALSSKKSTKLRGEPSTIEIPNTESQAQLHKPNTYASDPMTSDAVNGKTLSLDISPQQTIDQKVLSSSDFTKSGAMPQLNKQQEIKQSLTKEVLSPSLKYPTLKPELQADQQGHTLSPLTEQPYDSIIQDARKQIGSTPEKPGKTIKQSLDNLYTQWVDRYHPIVKVADQAKAKLKGQQAMLRPENDPEYLVRRLTGAGGIADYRFKTELNPVLKEIEKLNIPKADIDVYLANKRIAGFGTAGRDVYGADPVKANQVVQAIESKYGSQVKDIANELYQYQNKGFQEMVDAGFISPENAQLIKQQNPDYSPLYRVMDEVNDYLGLPTRKTMQGSQPIQKMKGSTRQIESPLEGIIGNTFSQRAAIEKNRVAKSIVELNKIVPELGFQQVQKSGSDTITVWNNGQKQYFKVGQDIADVAKGANEESMNLVLKMLQAPASLLRQGATGRNPDFIVPNMVKDQLDAGVTSKYGYKPLVDYLSGLKSMINNDEIYQKWEKSGAKIDLGEISGKKSIKELFNEKIAKNSLTSWLTGGLDILSKYSEQPTRIGLFKNAYKKTGNELIAAMESRDATVDFARMGSKMKVANSIVPFLNVGVQGFDKLIRSAKDNPGKVLLNMGIYAAAPAISTTLYNLSKFPQEYNELPSYEKDSNFIIIKGRKADNSVDYIKIPKGNIIPLVSNPLESLLAYTYGNSKESFKEVLLKTLSQALPVIGDGTSVSEIATKSIGNNLPQAIKPITENLLNKSFYKYDSKNDQTKEIVPYYLKNKPNYQQSYPFTPVMYQKIGAVLDISPLQVQNLMEGYMAGYTKIPTSVVQSLYNISRGEKTNSNDIPIIRRFFGETIPSNSKQISTPEKQSSPGLFERITGKSAAAEPGVYEQSKEAPRNIMEKVSLAAQGIGVDPENTIKAIFTEERMRKISGNAMILERQVQLNKTPDKTDAVDHIIPLSLGGDNSPSNLRYVPKAVNDAKAKLETRLARELKEGNITKEEARRQVANFVKANDLGLPVQSTQDQQTNEKLLKTAKDSVKETGQAQTVNTKYIYRSQDGSVKTVDLSFQPTPPTLTGKKEIDKIAIAKFKGEITQKTNDIYELFLQKQLTMDEANKQISQLKQLSAKGSGSGGVRKPTFKKIKPIKVKKQKINKIKAVKPKKIKLIKPQQIKPLKVKKLKSKTQ